MCLLRHPLDFTKGCIDGGSGIDIPPRRSRAVLCLHGKIGAAPNETRRPFRFLPASPRHRRNGWFTGRQLGRPGPPGFPFRVRSQPAPGPARFPENRTAGASADPGGCLGGLRLRPEWRGPGCRLLGNLPTAKGSLPRLRSSALRALRATRGTRRLRAFKAIHIGSPSRRCVRLESLEAAPLRLPPHPASDKLKRGRFPVSCAFRLTATCRGFR